jgi:peroxiredoxin
VLNVGDAVPAATVWLAPREPVDLRELAAERPVLLLFYLFDWSST